MYNQSSNANINNLNTCYIQTLNNFDNDINSDNDILNYPTQQLYNSIDNQCNYNYDIKVDSSNMNTNFSIIHFNARSLVKNYNEITNYLNSLNHKFNVIVISETWLNVYNKDLYFIEDYNNIHITRDHKRGGGISLFIIKKLKYISIDALFTTSPNQFDMVTVKIIIPKSKDIIISGIYKYPEFDIINFSDIIYNLFNTFTTDNILYLCGDFNIDILQLNSSKVSHFIDILT